MRFLGLDIGTSAVKAIVVDETQRILASAEAELETQRPRPLWSEQNPDDWWRAVERVIARLGDELETSFGDIASIGLSGQMHGAVLLDEANRVIRPAVLWNDGRAAREADELARAMPQIGTIAGVPPMPGLTAPKLLWIRRHEPENFRRIAHVLLPKDYVRWRMTGEFATDMCDAAGSLWLDEARRRWSGDIIAACGLAPRQFPRLCEGTEISGRLAREVAGAWGLKSGTPVAAGAGDAAAGAIGIGAVEDGDTFISLGTSAQYFSVTRDYRPAPRNLIHAFAHGVPGRWFRMAALLNGASCLAWIAKVLGSQDIGALLAAAEKACDGPSRAMFLPYLTGERTPHNDSHAKGVLFGLTPDTTAEAIVQSVLEGVALSLADAQSLLQPMGARTLAVIGGGARSAFWMKLLASALDRTLTLYAGAETGPAFGAARLARIALTGEAVADVCTRPAIAAEIAPDTRLAEAYAARLPKFRALYAALKPIFTDAP
jgi:xylulokinase